MYLKSHFYETPLGIIINSITYIGITIFYGIVEYITANTSKFYVIRIKILFKIQIQLNIFNCNK